MLIRASSAVQSAPVENWQQASSTAGAVLELGEPLASLSFASAPVPGTVASALAARGELDLERPPDLDAQDHWYRAPLPRLSGEGRRVLVFEGLAGLAQVWLGTHLVLQSNNMFRRYEVDVTELLGAEAAELVLRFRSLGSELKARRPRPRWRTRLVDQQQLRWLRQTLIGRTPGFCPAVPPIGPFQAVRLELRQRWSRFDVQWQPAVTASGVNVSVRCTLAVTRGALVRAVVHLEGPAGRAEHSLEVTSVPNEKFGTNEAAESSNEKKAYQREIAAAAPNLVPQQFRYELCVQDTRASEGAATETVLSGAFDVQEPALWWPHTHGAQPRSRVRLRLSFDDGEEDVDLGWVGFRKLEFEPEQSSLKVNDVRVFCRGACWTTDDVLCPGGPASPRPTLEAARAAGMNMLRVAGTNVYESTAFYDACDELGILVWHEFMFANMHYPEDDAVFAAEVEAEVLDVLSRVQASPCLAVLCGGSEVQQQAAMLGLPEAEWSSALFSETLPKLARRVRADVPYFASTPTGGALPFHLAHGLAHYYGVGAYLRPLSDVRSAGVRFASECLAFANVPEERSLERFLGELETPPHHPRWKQRVPRDRGVGWDFDDVRDHYVGTLFGCDPQLLRRSDVGRYLALGRIVTGELMERVFGEWRRPGSSCAGGLVYWLKDFWLGAGWGVIDASGVPKSAYYALARSFSPLALLLSDEGLNGHHVHVLNETANAFDATLELVLLRNGQVEVGRAEHPLSIAPRSESTLSVDRLLGAFRDTTFSYRFGPANIDVVVARLRRAADGQLLGRAFAFPQGYLLEPTNELGLRAELAVAEGGARSVRISAQRFASWVALDVPGWRPKDNYVHVAPGEVLNIPLAPDPSDERTGAGWSQAINGAGPVRVESPPL